MVEKDLFGKALYDYWTHNEPQNMTTWTQITEPELLPTAYLFRDFDQMPASEQLALKMASGRILDIGAGSGIHSLWLQNNGQEVTALEISPISCRLMQERGIKNIVQIDFFNYQATQKFDTLLFLMNGVGIVKKAKYLDQLFNKINELITSNGQALVHSSDLKYLYKTGSGYSMPQQDYYGDMRFFVKYKNEVESFDWTYIDENTLRIYARQKGFKVKKLHQSDEGDFLLKLTKL